MKRFVGFLLFFLISLCFAPSTLAADENFYVSLTAAYKVQKDNVMAVTNTIEIVNQKTTVYAPTFKFSVKGMKPDNVKAFENGVAQPVEVTQDGDQSTFLVTFQKAVVGKGARRKFTLSLNDSSLIERNGDVWEIRLPSIEGAQDFLNAKATLTVLPDFGDLASASVTPKVISDTVLEFDKASLTHKITAAFGQFQMYQMLLSYEARNDTDRAITREIPLPPDNSYQKVTITEITPRPISVTADEDGNWIAKYDLKPHSRESVSIRGSIKVSSEPRKITTPSVQTLKLNTQVQPFWEIDKPALVAQSKDLNTPEQIYRFVVSHLKYNYDRVSANVSRYGALKTLSAPSDALCAEFTDLFIALARSKGIPAREVNGYAVVSDPHLTPLSLISDVLHAWPEYWDSTENRWVAVDPTWENTSGVDYFTQMDTKHITLTIHGAKSVAPLIPLDTTDTKKAIRFTTDSPLADTPELPQTVFEQSNSFSLLTTSYSLSVKNTTGQALYDQRIMVKDNRNTTLIDTTVAVIPPYGEYLHTLKLSNGVMGNGLPEKLTFSLNEQEIARVVDKKVAIASQLAIAFASILVILCIITLQARRS